MKEWALNTGKLSSGDLPRKSVVKKLTFPTFLQLFTADVKAYTFGSMPVVEGRGQNLVHLQQFGTVYAQ